MNSINHHYIPKFYLKGFTDLTGKLQVFDKTHNKFKKNKQTPKTIFFEKNRNTIKFKGIQTDKIEKLYANLESGFGQLFDLIRNGISEEEIISEQGIYLLKLFIAIQFWRLPTFDSFAKNYIKNIDLSKFNERMTVNNIPIGEKENIQNLINNDKGFRHYFRSFILPLLVFDTKVREHDYKCWKLHTVSNKFSNWDNILTCDKPFIVENISEIFGFKSKLIFPLSKTQFISYSPKPINCSDLPPIFSSKLSIAMYAQSQRYLVGANRNYMQQIIDIYYESYDKIDITKLQKEIFAYI